MLIFLPILLLTTAPLVMLAVRIWRPRFAYYWLAAAGAALLALPLVLAARLTLPLPSGLPLAAWQPVRFFPGSPILLLDSVSWPYALALAALALAVVLTDVARSAEADWISWGGSLLLAGLAMAAVLAGNLVTLLLAWGAIDLVEAALLLSPMMQSEERTRAVVAFFMRTGGVAVALWAGMAAAAAGEVVAFGAAAASPAGLSHPVGTLLLLAAALRLGVLPMHLPFTVELPRRRGLGAMMRLAPAAGSLALLARAAEADAPPGLSSWLLGACVLAGLYGGLAWLSAKDELDGRPFWILGMAMLALASAVRGQPAASMAWGAALLLSGGLLFLASARPRLLLPLPVLGLLWASALPFTPAWEGVRLYAGPFSFLVVLLLPVHALLLAGYIRHALHPAPAPPGLERWVWLVYPWGLALLPVSHILIGWLERPAPGASPGLLASWPALTALLLVGLAALLARRRMHQPAEAAFSPDAPQASAAVLQIVAILRRTAAVLWSVLSFEWLYRLSDGIYRLAGRGLAFINRVLEGDGGILWTLLLLTLLLSLLARQGLGG